MKAKLLLASLLLVAISIFNACSVGAEAPITSFSECVAAGNVVLRSYPARCVTKDGQSFVDESAKKILLLDEPAQEQKICKDLCGNGSCEEMVCMAAGCPCAESEESCPADCKK
jgi:hypothetical protein